MDDQEEIIEFYSDIISEVYSPEKISIQVALDGEAGLEWIKKEKFDFIMIDINMPGKNGIDVIEEAFDSGNIDGVPICMISGFLALTNDKLEQPAFENVILIQKPFEEPTIKRNLKLALKLPA